MRKELFAYILHTHGKVNEFLPQCLYVCVRDRDVPRIKIEQ